MNVLVIGATGGTGRLAVGRLLQEGHTVTAFVRDSSKVNLAHPRLRVAVGRAEDAASIDRAVAGHEAVLSAFGPRTLKRTDVQEVLMQGLVAAMQKHGVRRLVTLSAWGAGDSADHATLLFNVLRLTLLRHVYRDKERGEAHLARSDIEYTLVRPGRLLNAAARGNVRASRDGKGLKAELTRADLADFMVSQLTSREWVRSAPIIGY